MAFVRHDVSFLEGRRLRRLRQAPWSREMVRENRLSPADFIYPIFVMDAPEGRQAIATMPGQSRLGIKDAVEVAREARDLGIPALAIFPNTQDDRRSEEGSEALNPDNLTCRALRAIKNAVPEIGLVSDVALDPYTTHGHDGVMSGDDILNDETVEILVGQSLNQARAGCDVIAPSDMMDGRVGAIRRALDSEGHTNTLIMAYSAKYASAFYGPFRDAISSGNRLKGDKRTYQMDYANSDEALREAELDLEEGADIIMVKPGLPYLDVIRRFKDTFNAPIAAYQVSGEYAMIEMGAKAGVVDRDAAMMESLFAFKRAGCDTILTYFALDAARKLGA
ncbi:MAG: porphobilinogen synthase [Hyphomicrobiaceae bacterium]|nr:porphobilinogen synthase [Hyphomicrobiaceae bacterium]